MGQLLLAHAPNIPDEPGFQGDYTGTYEFNLGLRKVWRNLPRFQPFLGGGASIVGGGTNESFGVGSHYQEDSDSAYGYWVGMGFYWMMTETLHTGINAQYSWGTINLFDKDLNAGGIHLNVIIGYH